MRKLVRPATAALTFVIFALGADRPANAADSSRKPETQARDVLQQSIAAVGGLERLRAVESISYQSLAHTFFRTVEVSELSPQMVSYESDEVLLQPRSNNLDEKINWRFTEMATPVASRLTVTPEGGFSESDSTKTALSADQFYKAIDTLAANPIAALISAHDSSHLSWGRQSDEVAEISFERSIYGLPVRTTLGVNRQTHLLEWIEIDHSYSQDVFNAFWGPTTKRYVFAAWIIDPSGVHFPAKWEIRAHDEVEGQESLVGLRIGGDAAASDFRIPEEFKNAFESFHKSEEDMAKGNYGEGNHLDLHEGVTMLPGKQGAYNAIIVKQAQGILVIEGPYSNANSEYVIQYAKKLYPNTPIVGVFTTSHLRWLMGGLPAYAKANIPVYALDVNAAAVRHFLTTQTTADSVRRQDLKLRTVQGRTEIGRGLNRMVLLPFRGTTSVRMMAVYFPDQRLLYCSDLFMPQAWEKEHWTEHLWEIRDLIDREHIEVLDVMGVSAVPKGWKELAATLPARAND